MTAERWASLSESGSLGALRLGRWLARHVGRGFFRALIWLPALYFAVRSGPARRGSLQYQRHLAASAEGRAALGRPPGLRLVLRHLHAFGMSLYDRFLVWTGALDRMDVAHDGSEGIFELARSGRGAILLGAHLGSLDMLWFLARRYRLRVNVVAFYENARRVNDFLEASAPDAQVRVIDIDPASVRAAFEIKACVERGELVVILADRVAPGKAGRTARVPFFGRPADFPLAPFLLSIVLRCPVRLALCVATGDARYETILRPLGDGEPVPRGERDKRARELLLRYVSLLESFCLRHPLQWFNLYEFWEEEA